MSWASHPVHGSVVFHDRRWVDRTLRFIICFRTSVWMGTSLRSSRVWMTFISGRTYFLLIHQRHYFWMLKYWEQRNHSIIYYSLFYYERNNHQSYLLSIGQQKLCLEWLVVSLSKTQRSHWRSSAKAWSTWTQLSWTETSPPNTLNGPNYRGQGSVDRLADSIW